MILGENEPDIVEQDAAEEQQRESAIRQILRDGPANFISWLGNNEVWVGQTKVSTAGGKLTVHQGVTQQDAAQISRPDAVNWFQSLPSWLKYGGPAVGLFLLLRK